MIKAIGLIAEPTPSTSRILKMFDPMTFPTAISTSFFRAATIEVTSSGRLVPIAQIVSPISVWLIPNAAAMSDAESTTKSPPYLIATPPSIMNNRLFHTGRIFASSPSTSTSMPAALAFRAERIMTTRKMAKQTINTIPSTRLIDISSQPAAKSRMAHTIETGKSRFRVSS